LELSYLTTLFEDGDVIVDYPTDDFPTMRAYVVAVYHKGALGFRAIQEEIGDDAFFAGLRDYVARHRFGVATPDDLRRALAEAAGRELDESWRHWFEAAEGHQDYTPADLEEVYRLLGR
jgi:aminopeptidase N